MCVVEEQNERIGSSQIKAHTAEWKRPNLFINRIPRNVEYMNQNSIYMLNIGAEIIRITT